MEQVVLFERGAAFERFWTGSANIGFWLGLRNTQGVHNFLGIVDKDRFVGYFGATVFTRNYHARAGAHYDWRRGGDYRATLFSGNDHAGTCANNQWLGFRQGDASGAVWAFAWPYHGATTSTGSSRSSARKFGHCDRSRRIGLCGGTIRTFAWTDNGAATLGRTGVAGRGGVGTDRGVTRISVGVTRPTVGVFGVPGINLCLGTGAWAYNSTAVSGVGCSGSSGRGWNCDQTRKGESYRGYIVEQSVAHNDLRISIHYIREFSCSRRFLKGPCQLTLVNVCQLGAERSHRAPKTPTCRA